MAEEHPSVTLFREYLRIKSVHPNPDYESCNVLLKRIAKELDLPHFITEMEPGKPIFVMTWEGLEPQLPSILLNSHTDVVPVRIICRTCSIFIYVLAHQLGPGKIKSF